MIFVDQMRQKSAVKWTVKWVVKSSTIYICKSNQFCEDILVSVHKFLKKKLDKTRIVLFLEKNSIIDGLIKALWCAIFYDRVVVLNNISFHNQSLSILSIKRKFAHFKKNISMVFNKEGKIIGRFTTFAYPEASRRRYTGLAAQTVMQNNINYLIISSTQMLLHLLKHLI